MAAVKLISVLKPVIDRRRRLALIVDDTLMARSCSKKTELLAKVYDHDKHEFLTGYRGLTVGWSDGNTFLPVNFALMSTKKKENMIGNQPVATDQRSIAGRRRTQAQRPRKFIIVTADAFMVSKACMNVWLPPKRGSKGKYLVLATTQYKASTGNHSALWPQMADRNLF